MIVKQAKTLVAVGLLAFVILAGFPISEAQASDAAAPVQQEIGTNLLTNPGFEGIGVPVNNGGRVDNNSTRDTFTGAQYGEIYSPAGWVAWWEEGDYKRPECVVIPNEHPFNVDPVRIYQGYYAVKCFSFFGKYHAGYYQVVRDVAPGSRVQASFYAHAWSCGDDNPPLSCGDPNSFYFRVGIDPNGGTDPFAGSVVWGPATFHYDTYGKVGPVEATVGESGAATVFLEGLGKWPNKHNDAYMDNPSLQLVSAGQPAEPTSPPPPPTSETPPTPQATPTPRPDGSVVHVVESGDTLFGLAIQYGVDVQQIYDLNNLGSDDLLSVGQEIVISTTGDVAQPTPTPTVSSETSEPEVTEEASSPEEGTGNGSGSSSEPAEGKASVCVLAFYDANGNMFREAEEGEMLLPNAEASLLAQSGPVDSRTTDGISEPWCFEDLEPGNYILRHTPPPGYTMTDGGQYNFGLKEGQVLDVELAYVRDEDASTDNPSPGNDPATESPGTNPTEDAPEENDDSGGMTDVLNVVLRVSGFIVLALAIAVLVLFVLSRRSG